MKAYEVLLMLDPRLDDDARVAMVDKAKDLVANNGGAVDNVDEWGKRSLAYEINNLKDAYYVLVDFKAEPTVIAEIDRVLHISDPVVRYMIVRREDRDAE